MFLCGEVDSHGTLPLISPMRNGGASILHALSTGHPHPIERFGSATLQRETQQFARATVCMVATFCHALITRALRMRICTVFSVFITRFTYLWLEEDSFASSSPGRKERKSGRKIFLFLFFRAHRHDWMIYVLGGKDIGALKLHVHK